MWGVSAGACSAPLCAKLARETSRVRGLRFSASFTFFSALSSAGLGLGQPPAPARGTRRAVELSRAGRLTLGQALPPGDRSVFAVAEVLPHTRMLVPGVWKLPAGPRTPADSRGGAGIPRGSARPFHCSPQRALAPKRKQTCPGRLPPWTWLRAQMVHGTGRRSWPSLAVLGSPYPPHPPSPPKTNTKLQLGGRHILSVVAGNRPGAG